MAQISEDVLNRLKELSCEDVAEQLGLDVKMHHTLCFMHSDKHPSLAFLGEGRKGWYCFSCKKGGNAIDLVREKMECGFVEACTWLCSRYGIDMGENISKYKARAVSHTQPKKIQKIKEEKKFFAKEVAEFIIENSILTEAARNFLFEERKLRPEIIHELKIVSIDTPWELLRKMEVRFDTKTLADSGIVRVSNGKCYFRLFSPCLIIPYFDVNGELVGLQSRYLGTSEGAPRFQFLSSQKTHLFNLPILKTMNRNDELYISEGITDCLALLSSGKKAVAIPSATILPEKDLTKLTEFKLRMYPDQDDAGEQAFVCLQRFFIRQLTFLKAIRLPEGFKDYSDYYKIQYGE